MPARSKISLLPEAVRAELDRMLIKNGFSNYGALSAWLNDQGCEVSRSGVHRHGQAFEDRLSALKIATDQAKAIAAAAEDDAGAMNEALIRLVQERTFTLLVELEHGAPDLAKIGRMAAELARASIAQKKHAATVRAEALAEAAKRAGEAGELAGLSEATIAEIRTRIMMGVSA